jgi:hypothetical protein
MLSVDDAEAASEPTPSTSTAEPTPDPIAIEDDFLCEDVEEDADIVDDTDRSCYSTPKAMSPAPPRKRSRSLANRKEPATPAVKMQDMIMLEHKLKLEQMREEHKMKMEILEIEREIAKLKLERLNIY